MNLKTLASHIARLQTDEPLSPGLGYRILRAGSSVEFARGLIGLRTLSTPLEAERAGRAIEREVDNIVDVSRNAADDSS